MAQRIIIHKVQYKDTRGRFTCEPHKACRHRSSARRKPCKRKPDGPYIEVRERQTAFGGPRLEFYYHDPELDKHIREAKKRRDYQTMKQAQEVKRRILDDLIEHYRRQESGADLDNPYDEHMAMKQYEIEARARAGAAGRLAYLERVAKLEKQYENHGKAKLKELARDAYRKRDGAPLQAIRRILKARKVSRGEIDLIAPKLPKPKKRRGRR